MESCVSKSNQFSNHNSQDIERQSYDVVERTALTYGSDNWYQLRHLRNGFIELRHPATDSQYVWITKNGTLLDSAVDYKLTSNKKYIKLIETLEEGDTIELFHFSNAVIGNKFGWRQFKDITNKTHYKRLNGTENNILAENLNWYDKSVQLVDASNLPAPDPNSKYPAVIWIGSERLEYFIKDGNYLKQLRRGTFGTGVKDVYSEGTEVYDQSRTETMPYTDETLSTVFTTDETTNQFELDFVAQSVNEFEVFLAGKRLRKNAISKYQFEERDTNGDVITDMIAQDSPEGDITIPAEFTIENTTNAEGVVVSSKLVLASVPNANQKLIIVRRQGKIWTDPGTPLKDADSDIGRFLRATTVDLPR